MTNEREQIVNDPIAGILLSDLAIEIRAEFEGRRSVGYDVPAATSHVINRFKAALTSPSEGPVLLVALAALQLREEYLQPVIRDAALDLIESDEALNAYRSLDAGQRKATKAILNQLAQMLEASPVQDETEQ